MSEITGALSQADGQVILTDVDHTFQSYTLNFEDHPEKKELAESNLGRRAKVFGVSHQPGWWRVSDIIILGLGSKS